MKTIVNKIRFALLLGFMAIGLTALAQSIPNAEKMSISTLMFLDEMAGRISFDEPTPTIKVFKTVHSATSRVCFRWRRSPQSPLLWNYIFFI